MLAYSAMVMDKVSNEQSLEHTELLQLQSDLHLLNRMSVQDYKMIAEWAVSQLLSVQLNALDNIQSIQTGGQDELQL
mgnify:CR=1 FL=1|jgi:hypothetical protein